MRLRWRMDELKGYRGTKSKAIPGPRKAYGFLTIPKAVVRVIHPNDEGDPDDSRRGTSGREHGALRIVASGAEKDGQAAAKGYQAPLVKKASGTVGSKLRRLAARLEHCSSSQNRAQSDDAMQQPLIMYAVVRQRTHRRASKEAPMSLVLAIVNALRPSPSHLEEVGNFGTNPGALRMLTYLPAKLRPRPALIVVLHGSTQSAASYDLGAGWSKLADQHGFVLLMPEQCRQNNLTGSFNWFRPDDMQRGEGEAHSIIQMVEHMVREHDIDRDRIFISGLSAGGAMTLVMLATYPEVFAAGAIIAGLPYGRARNAPEALQGMFRAPARSSSELGDLVRGASPQTVNWPKLSVWHGSADRTVKPSNADEIIKQWLDVHGLPLHPMSEHIVDGHVRRSWYNPDGVTVIESYTIADMAHGTPLSAADVGVPGPYMLDAGISSSDHIARFFGLSDAASKPDISGLPDRVSGSNCLAT